MVLLLKENISNMLCPNFISADWAGPIGTITDYTDIARRGPIRSARSGPEENFQPGYSTIAPIISKISVSLGVDGSVT